MFGKAWMRAAGLIVAGVLVVGAVGCSSSGPGGGMPTAPTNAGGNGGGTGGGGTSGGATTTALTATIDGQPWNPLASALNVSYANGVLTIGGIDAAGWAFALAMPTSGPGPVPLSSGANAVLTAPLGAQSWSATWLDGGSATITVTSFSPSSAAGTFSVNMVPGPGGSGTKSVTGGTFNVTF